MFLVRQRLSMKISGTAGSLKKKLLGLNVITDIKSVAGVLVLIPSKTRGIPGRVRPGLRLGWCSLVRSSCASSSGLCAARGQKKNRTKKYLMPAVRRA